MTELEKVYVELEKLTEDVRALTYCVFQYNPAFTDNGKKPLSSIGVEARSIGNRFENLGVNILNESKKRQEDDSSTTTI